MEQEVVQSCLKGSFLFHCKESEKSGKTTRNRNKRILIRVGIEKQAEGRQERLSVVTSVGMALSSFKHVCTALAMEMINLMICRCY